MILSRIPHYIYLLFLLSLLQSATLIFFKQYCLHFVKCSSVWIYLIFCMIWLRILVYSLYKNTTEMVVQIGDLNHLLKVVSARLYTVKWLFFPLWVINVSGEIFEPMKICFFSSNFCPLIQHLSVDLTCSHYYSDVVWQVCIFLFLHLFLEFFYKEELSFSPV